MTYEVYRYVNRGLFEKDKATFKLMMCFKILVTAGKINGNDVGTLLKGGAALATGLVAGAAQVGDGVRACSTLSRLRRFAAPGRRLVHTGGHSEAT